MSSRRSLTLAAAALGAFFGTGAAQAQNLQVGFLNCDVSGGLGLIITSQKELLCTFRNNAGEIEVYTGFIRRVGLDLGGTTGGQMVWDVLAPSGRVVRGALSGAYVGASAEATLGGGFGANILVGGSDHSIALQPISVQGQAGLNLAVGVADLVLNLAPSPPLPAGPPRRG
jgi:Protein of unknown function (DUF992)